MRQKEVRTVSKWLVARAATSHSGNHPCAPSVTDRAAIRVHVFNGRFPFMLDSFLLFEYYVLVSNGSCCQGRCKVVVVAFGCRRKVVVVRLLSSFIYLSVYF